MDAEAIAIAPEAIAIAPAAAEVACGLWCAVCQYGIGPDEDFCAQRAT
jgi:hypothetical protein